MALNEFVNFTPYDEQMAEIQRRQRMADLMQQQAQAPLETPQSGGRMIAKVSPVAGLAKMLQAYMAGKQQRQIGEQQKELGRQDVQNAMSLMDRLQAGKVSEMSPDQALAASMSTQPTAQAPNQPFTPQERTQQLIRGSMTGGPRTQALAQMLMAQKQPTIWDYVEKPKIGEGGIDPTSLANLEADVAAGRTPRASAIKLQPKQEKLPLTQLEQLHQYRDRLSSANPNDPRIQDVNDEIRKIKTSGPATVVNVPVNTERTYAGTVATKLAESDATAIDAARSAPAQIQSSMRIKSLLAQNPITGTGANARLSLDKALSTAGVIDPSRSQTTENLVSELANSTLNAIKTSNLGTGQGFTNSDREFLEKAKSGNIEINSQTLSYLADLNERTARANIDRGNKVMQRLRKSKNFGSEFGLEDIVAPERSSALPQGFQLVTPNAPRN